MRLLHYLDLTLLIVLQVVITGSSRGLGYALADQFLQFGDDVVISSRDMSACELAAAQLREKHPARKALPHACDVRNAGGARARLDACLHGTPHPERMLFWCAQCIASLAWVTSHVG